LQKNNIEALEAAISMLPTLTQVVLKKVSYSFAMLSFITTAYTDTLRLEIMFEMHIEINLLHVFFFKIQPNL